MKLRYSELCAQEKLRYIELATKWLRLLSISPNDKIRDHLVANPIYNEEKTFRFIPYLVKIEKRQWLILFETIIEAYNDN